MCAPLKLQQSYDVHAARSRCRAAYSTAYSIPRQALTSHGTNDAEAKHRGSAGELQTRLRRGAAHRCSPASKMKRTSPMRPFVALPRAPSPLRAFGVASASMTTGSSVLTKTAAGNDAAGASAAAPVGAHNTPKRPSADVGWASLVPVPANGGSKPSPVPGKGSGGAQSRRVCGARASPFSPGADAARLLQRLSPVPAQMRGGVSPQSGRTLGRTGRVLGRETPSALKYVSSAPRNLPPPFAPGGGAAARSAACRAQRVGRRRVPRTGNEHRRGERRDERTGEARRRRARTRGVLGARCDVQARTAAARRRTPCRRAARARHTQRRRASRARAAALPRTCRPQVRAHREYSRYPTSARPPPGGPHAPTQAARLPGTGMPTNAAVQARRNAHAALPARAHAASAAEPETAAEVRRTASWRRSV
jgi:hypothetical protein